MSRSLTLEIVFTLLQCEMFVVAPAFTRSPKSEKYWFFFLVNCSMRQIYYILVYA